MEAKTPPIRTVTIPLDAYAFVVGTLQQAALGASVRQTAVECLRLLGVGAEPDTGEEDTEILYPVQGE